MVTKLSFKYTEQTHSTTQRHAASNTQTIPSFFVQDDARKQYRLTSHKLAGQAPLWCNTRTGLEPRPTSYKLITGLV